MFTLQIDAIRNGDVHLVQHQRRHLPDLHPILDDVVERSVRRGDGEPDHILALQRRRHTVLVAAIVEPLEQPFGDLVGTAYAEHNQSQMPLGRQLEAMIGQDKCLELLRQPYAFAYMSLQTLNAKGTQDEPHLEGTEATTQRNLPVHKVDGHARVLVLQIQRFHIEGAMHGGAVAHPHGSRIKVHHQPLGGIEGNGIGSLDATQPGAELGADEGAASVGSIHVQPQIVLPTDDANLSKGILYWHEYIVLQLAWG